MSVRSSQNIDSLITKIDDFVTSMDAAKNLDQIFQIIRPQIEALGFERFAYWLVWPPEGPRKPLYMNSYPVGWVDQYMEEFVGDDMVMRYAAVHTRPYSWSEIFQKYDLTERQKIVFSASKSVGLRSGATVPIFGPGKAKAVFSVANNESDQDFLLLFNERRHALHIMATYAHEKIMALGIQNNKAENVFLTAREIEILTWTARGKTRWEISRILSVSEETVKSHTENICGKLQAQNKTHAAAIALINGLIFP
jgi:DNA-binding CsgD family transcriptional regulator